MIFVCINWDYSDTTCFLLEHGNAEEALVVLRTLSDHNGPDVVAFGDMTIVERETCPRERTTLPEVVSGHLFTTWGANATIQQALFDALPLSVLRAAVEDLAGRYERDGQSWRVDAARLLREALFLREQRDRIATDLTNMERIAALGRSTDGERRDE